MLRVSASNKLTYHAELYDQGFEKVFLAYDELLLQSVRKLLGRKVDFNHISAGWQLGIQAIAPRANELRQRRIDRTNRRNIDRELNPEEPQPSNSWERSVAGSRGASFLFVNGSSERMNSLQQRTSLLARIGLLPFSLPFSCSCKKVFYVEHECLQHLLACDRSSSVSHTRRHDAVVNVAYRVLSRFNVGATLEPHGLYAYDDLSQKRPDLTVHSSPPIAIDFSFVDPDETPGKAAADATEAKRQKHQTAAAKKGHSFFGFVGENGGHYDQKAESCVTALSRSLPHWLCSSFKKEFWHAITTTFEREKAETILSAGLRRAQRSRGSVPISGV